MFIQKILFLCYFNELHWHVFFGNFEQIYSVYGKTLFNLVILLSFHSTLTTDSCLFQVLQYISTDWRFYKTALIECLSIICMCCSCRFNSVMIFFDILGFLSIQLFIWIYIIQGMICNLKFPFFLAKKRREKITLLFIHLIIQKWRFTLKVKMKW